MALPASGAIDLQQIYDEAITLGYTGTKDLASLAKWPGWNSGPSGSLPHLLTDFYGAESIMTTRIGTHNINNDGNVEIGEFRIVNYTNHSFNFLSRTFSLEDIDTYGSYYDSTDIMINSHEIYILNNIKLYTLPDGGFKRIGRLSFHYAEQSIEIAAKLIIPNPPSNFDLIPEGYEKICETITGGSAGGQTSDIIRSDETDDFSSTIITEATFNMQLVIF